MTTFRLPVSSRVEAREASPGFDRHQYKLPVHNNCTRTAPGARCGEFCSDHWVTATVQYIEYTEYSTAAVIGGRWAVGLEGAGGMRRAVSGADAWTVLLLLTVRYEIISYRTVSAIRNNFVSHRTCIVLYCYMLHVTCYVYCAVLLHVTC